MDKIDALEETLKGVLDIPVLYNRRPDGFPCFVISFYNMESGLAGNGQGTELTEGCMVEFWYKSDYLAHKKDALKIRDAIAASYTEPLVNYDNDSNINAYRATFRFQYIVERENDGNE